MKLLVTGTQGQVALSLQARAGAHDVVLLGRPELDLLSPDAAKRALEEALQTHQPDVIVNAAAYTAVDKAEEEAELALQINGTGAGLVAEVAANHSLPILQLSTDYVFDGSKPAPYVETDPLGPVSSYGRSKLEGERLVAGANPRHIILRTAWVYSPYGHNFVKTMVRLAQTRDELGIVGDQLGNPTSALDIADGVLAVAQKGLEPEFGAWGVYHLSGRGEATWAEFAREIFRLSAEAGGPSASVKSITKADYPTPAKRPANSRLDCTKLEATFSWQARNWREALGEVVDNQSL